MYARVVRFQLKSGTFERGIAALRDRVLPDLRAEPGWRGGQMLVERETGEVLVIGQFDTDEGARRRDEVGFRRRLDMLEGLLADRPRPSFYEVLDETPLG